MEPLLRASEVATLLNVRPTTIYALASRGVLAHVRITHGRKRALVRFRVEDVDALIRKRLVLTADVDTTRI